MKNLCNILVFVLAFTVFCLGAGAGMVHICSTCCKAQICSSVMHSHTDMSGYCYHSNDNASCTSVSEECSCINVHYNIDFFKVSQNGDLVSFVSVPFDLPEHISYIIPLFSAGLLFLQSPDAPPAYNSGRTLLVFHSVLII